MSTPTRDECIERAGEAYGAVLADPERREQLRRHRAERTQAAGSKPSTDHRTPAA